MAFHRPIPLNHSAFISPIQIIRPCPGLHHLHIRHFYFCQIMYFPELATVRSTAISDQDVILLRRGPWFSLKHLDLYAEISYIVFLPIQWHIIMILTLPFQLNPVQMSSRLLAHLLELLGASSISAGLVSWNTFLWHDATLRLASFTCLYHPLIGLELYKSSIYIILLRWV